LYSQKGDRVISRSAIFVIGADGNLGLLCFPDFFGVKKRLRKRAARPRYRNERECAARLHGRPLRGGITFIAKRECATGSIAYTSYLHNKERDIDEQNDQQENAPKEKKRDDQGGVARERRIRSEGAVSLWLAAHAGHLSLCQAKSKVSGNGKAHASSVERKRRSAAPKSEVRWGDGVLLVPCWRARRVSEMRGSRRSLARARRPGWSATMSTVLSERSGYLVDEYAQGRAGGRS
jgi:hypothetical protein